MLCALLAAAAGGGMPQNGAAGALLPADYPDSVVASISVGGDPTNVAFLPLGDYIYVANETDNRVTVVRMSDRTVVARIPAGDSPWEITAHPSGEYVYTSNLGSDDVSVIRTSDNAVVATVPVGLGPCLSAIRPSGDYLYVTNSASSSVTVIRTSNNTVAATVPVGSGPRGITVLPNGECIYTANMGGSVSVIRASNNQVVATVPTGGSVHRACATLDGEYVYVSLYGSANVVVVRTSDNTVVRTINLSGNAIGISMLPGSHYAYVSCGGANSVAVIRTTDHTLVGYVPVGHSPWGASPTADGRYVCTADRYSRSVTVIGRRYVDSLDVGVIRIISPYGNLDSGTSVAPAAIVRNYGQLAASFPITMLIGSGYARTVTDSLAPGQLDTVEFPGWTAAPVGPVPVICFTALPGDENRANDTATTVVTIAPGQPQDVAAVTIIAPDGIVDSGTAVTPMAIVTNLGTATASFPATMRIGTTYGYVVQETLAAGMTDTVSFPVWIAAPTGTHPVTCFTSLIGDRNRTNDTIYGSVSVRPRRQIDVGVVTIASPRGTVDSASTVTPRVEVRNFGNTDAVFEVSLNVGLTYQQSIIETLAAGASDTVPFPDWVALPTGWIRIVSRTSLAGDMNPANDTFCDSVYVIGERRHDVLPDSFLQPHAAAMPGDTIIPCVRVRNRGNLAERYFDVSVRIGTGYSSSRTVINALPPGGSFELTFDPWPAEPGSYTVVAVTQLGTDQNRQNDTLATSLYVYTAPDITVEWDRADVIRPAERKTYRFYAELRGDVGDSVRLGSLAAPTGWGAALFDSAAVSPISELGFITPGSRRWFSLSITAPAGLSGLVDTVRFWPTAATTSNPPRRDSALLRLSLAPELGIHNYPNPFPDQTTFIIGLPFEGTATLTVFNRAGETVVHLLRAVSLSAGVHSVTWNALNTAGARAAPGVYDYLLDFHWAGRSERIRKKLVVQAR